MVFNKKTGKDYEQYYRDISNSYISRFREYPQDVREVARQLEYYKPTHFYKKSSEDVGS